MTTITVSINGNNMRFNVAPDTPLLWVIRDFAGLKGTKYGCGIGQCGACTVHIDAKPARSCIVPIAQVVNKTVTTIEGISSTRFYVLQQAWIDEDVPQCGYCQAGQIMSATALLARNSSPTEEEISTAMTGNLCRCGTYPRIRKAIRKASEALN
jgi:isoquinoline 1-oxidoreductase alpha subunit